MKKIAVVIIAAFLLPIIAACGSSNTPEPTPPYQLPEGFFETGPTIFGLAPLGNAILLHEVVTIEQDLWGDYNYQIRLRYEVTITEPTDFVLPLPERSFPTINVNGQAHTRELRTHIHASRLFSWVPRVSGIYFPITVGLPQFMLNSEDFDTVDEYHEAYNMVTPEDIFALLLEADVPHESRFDLDTYLRVFDLSMLNEESIILIRGIGAMQIIFANGDFGLSLIDFTIDEDAVFDINDAILIYRVVHAGNAESATRALLAVEVDSVLEVAYGNNVLDYTLISLQVLFDDFSNYMADDADDFMELLNYIDALSHSGIQVHTNIDTNIGDIIETLERSYVRMAEFSIDEPGTHTIEVNFYIRGNLHPDYHLFEIATSDVWLNRTDSVRDIIVVLNNGRQEIFHAMSNSTLHQLRIGRESFALID